MKKIALCFLTYGNLSKSKFWNDLLDSNLDKFNIYIHNKKKFKDNNFEKYCLKKTVDTQWGHSSLVKATLTMFKDAIKNIDNEHFLLLSDTCIPLYPLDYIYSEIFKENNNLIYVQNKTNVARYDKKMLDKIFLKRSNFCKQSQWMCLTRNTIDFFIKKNYIKKFGKDFPILDEHYFISLIKKYNIEYKQRLLTFCKFNQKNKTHPKKYKTLDKYIIAHKRSLGALFIRKIDPNCQNVELILENVC